LIDPHLDPCIRSSSLYSLAASAQWLNFKWTANNNCTDELRNLFITLTHRSYHQISTLCLAFFANLSIRFYLATLMCTERVCGGAVSVRLVTGVIVPKRQSLSTLDWKTHGVFLYFSRQTRSTHLPSK